MLFELWLSKRGQKSLLVFATMSLLITPVFAMPLGKADVSNAQQVLRGKLVYKKFCSLCHGIDLKGQPNWRVRNADGKLPAPPHDETGHTWHHADELLFGIIKYGLVPPYGPENYKNDMPGWGSTLGDEDIWAVLSYIKSQWPEELREAQEDMSRRSFSSE